MEGRVHPAGHGPHSIFPHLAAEGAAVKKTCPAVPPPSKNSFCSERKGALNLSADLSPGVQLPVILILSCFELSQQPEHHLPPGLHSLSWTIQRPQPQANLGQKRVCENHEGGVDQQCADPGGTVTTGARVYGGWEETRGGVGCAGTASKNSTAARGMLRKS